MGESHRTAPPPGYGNPASSPSCTDEFTSSTADASFLTAENFRDALHHTANERLGDCTRWTNEKHNLYLDILEASFVKQLYQSTLLSKCSEQNKNNRNVVKELPAKMDRVFEQFPALQASCCNKNNIERDRPALYTAIPSSHAQQLYEADLHKCHKLHSEKKCLQEKRKFPCGLAKRSELHTDLQNSVCSVTGKLNSTPYMHLIESFYFSSHTPMLGYTEGSGQNFVDGCEENTDSKRRKAARGDISSHEVHDQVKMHMFP
nr:uncharacterized protein LOC109162138 [Ipomoea batatas]